MFFWNSLAFLMIHSVLFHMYIESMKAELKEAECSMVVSRSWSVQEKERCWSKYTDF